MHITLFWNIQFYMFLYIKRKCSYVHVLKWKYHFSVSASVLRLSLLLFESVIMNITFDIKCVFQFALILKNRYSAFYCFKYISLKKCFIIIIIFDCVYHIHSYTSITAWTQSRCLTSFLSSVNAGLLHSSLVKINIPDF